MPRDSELHQTKKNDHRSSARRGLLHNLADRRSLFWALGLFPVMPLLGILVPRLAVFLLPLALYLGFLAGVLAHYHNHRGVFRSGFLNRLYSVWLSVFYGFPLFAWIPTHNQNHHKHVNGPGDETRTSRSQRPDSLSKLLFYPSQSGLWQAPVVYAYLVKLKRGKPVGFLWAITQILAIFLTHGLVLGLALRVNGVLWGALGYGLLMGLPALWASWSMMFVNYIQHVDCDFASPTEHSRDFVGDWENWLVFNAGFHTVHHEHPGVHWSEYPRLHEERRGESAPRFCERNIYSFIWRRYLKPARPRESEKVAMPGHTG